MVKFTNNTYIITKSNYSDIFPLVSIIIPVFNTDKYLRQCLESCVNQTYKNIEIICINDCSTDNSYSILTAFQTQYKHKYHFTIINNKTNKLAGYSRNIGIKAAHGKYILFVDSDDFFDTTLIEKTVIKSEITNADICLFKLNRFINNQYKNTYFKYPENITTQNNIDILELIPPGPIKLFNRKFIQSNNLLFTEKLHNTEDIYFVILSILLSKNIEYINEYLYTYRNNERSSQNTKSIFPIDCLTASTQLIKQVMLLFTDVNLIEGIYCYIYKLLKWNFNSLNLYGKNVFRYFFYRNKILNIKLNNFNASNKILIEYNKFIDILKYDK